MKRFLNYIIISFLIIGCKSKKQNNNFILTHELSKVESSQFPLDSLSNANTRGVQVYPSEKPLYLFYFHNYSKDISIYNLEDSTFVKKIYFNSEGPRSIPKSISYSFIHNFDSIFLFDPLRQTLYLSDTSGNLNNKFDLNLGNQHYVYADGTRPITIEGKNLWLPAYPDPLRQATSEDFGAVKYDISKGKVIDEINLSEKYDEGFWGMHSYGRTVTLFNHREKILVVSYPNDPVLLVIENDGTKRRIYAGSRYMHNLSPVADNYIEDDQAIFRIQAMQGFYSGLQYDHWNNVYYRICFDPIQDYEDPQEIGKNASILILNSDFERIGQTKINGMYYSLGISFITSKGLHLFNDNNYNNVNDNVLTFDLFKLIENKP